MADDFPAELERAYARIEDLEQKLQIAKLFERKLRNKAWWKTYRAALTGNHSFSNGDGTGMSAKNAHDESVTAANLAHGPLDGRPEE